MKKPLDQILSNYGRMAGIFILLNNKANTTVVVTDIDPDTTINLDGEFYLLDMDNNAVSDFIIFKDSGYYYYEGYSSTTLRFRQLVAMGPQYTTLNKILGAHYYNSWTGADFYFPIPLIQGEEIGSSQTFYNFPVQIICAGHLENIGSVSGFHLGPGYWLAPGNHGVENRYLGVSFLDEDENRYYGWVRCSTADSMKAITIHEYAFENVPNTPIIAGDTTSYIAVENFAINNPLQIWSYESIIYYNYNGLNPQEIKIVNSSGNILFSVEIISGSGSIDLGNQSKGVYFVKSPALNCTYKLIL